MSPSTTVNGLAKKGPSHFIVDKILGAENKLSMTISWQRIALCPALHSSIKKKEKFQIAEKELTIPPSAIDKI